MKAAVIRDFGPVEKLEVQEFADPIPAAGEVVIDVHATAVNFVDLLVISGKYQFLPPRPFVPGKLPVGVVSAVGDGVDKVRPGDRVLTLAEHGGYAEKALAKEGDCFKLPDDMSFVDAASMALAYDTAWFALCERARAKLGETVLVLGASGGVGLAAIQLAKAYGLRVIAGISDSSKTQLVVEAGADACVDLSVADLQNGLREQVYALTDGKGADIVLDPLGDKFFDAAIRAVAWCGRLVIIGFAAGNIPTLKVNYLLLKNIEVSGIQVSDYRKRAPEKMAHCIAEIFRLYSDGKLVQAPVSRYQLDDVSKALVDLRDRRVPGRLILEPSEA
ncbi:NADPH:quinone oxidoreductase family protein [Paraburkholderia sediminicola]|uniref:NADPH:quinone oxidoreductase family protein n=1 Tax=Paraburkholderia sediminicola TaxID=458836 RepID=UPI0038BCB6E0